MSAFDRDRPQPWWRARPSRAIFFLTLAGLVVAICAVALTAGAYVLVLAQAAKMAGAQ